MPGLSLCWGNRANFNVFGEFAEKDGPSTWSDFSALVSPASPSSNTSPPNQSYVSSSTYYGYERVPAGHSFESMDVDNFRHGDGMTGVDSGQPPVTEAQDLRERCRKRWNSESQVGGDVKRPRLPDEVKQDSRRPQVITHNLGHCLL